LNSVDPIRDRKKIAQIKNQFRGEKRFRGLLLFSIGINSALRVSDLLKLRIDNFIDEDGEIRERFWLREENRNKRHEVIITKSIRDADEEYRTAYPTVEDDLGNFLFFNTRSRDYTRSISCEQAWYVVINICKVVGLKGNYGTHTLRKTWGIMPEWAALS
jgi:integrase